MSTPNEIASDEILRAAQASQRRRDWNTRYAIARTDEEALTACEDVRLWLEELACNVILDHAGEHCVAEALRDLRAVRTYIGSLLNDQAER